MKNYLSFKNEMTQVIKKALIVHFNEIYVCSKLEEHEIKIAYLAYLWKNGQVINEPGYIVEILNEKEHGVDLHKDYEITVEAGPDENGGVNLDLMYDFYRFDELMELVK